MKGPILGLLLVLAFSPAILAQVSPELYSGLQWRSIGPFRGGRAVAASGVPGGGSTFYFGAVDGGIWKTSDAGSVWTPIFDGQPAASIGALEVAPSDSNVIYAGTGESDIRSDLASGDGVYKSTDAGKTWQNIGLKDTRQISRIVVGPKDPNLVFVAALGHAYGPNQERGVFRSKDGGDTWQKVLYLDPNVGAADLAISADHPQTLFAAMWDAHRAPWSTYAPIVGMESGLYRSVDNGSTWKQITGSGFPQGHVGRIGVAIAPGTQGKRIYAVVEAANDTAGLYRSDDGGDSWIRVNSDPRLTSRGWYFNCITADPNDPDVLYVPNIAFYKLSDGGKTLSIVRGAPGGDDYHQVWIDPANSAHMVLATDQGTTVSVNGGKTWSTWYNQPTAQFYHVITDNDVPYHVYGAQQDSGTAATPSRTDHSQIDLRDWFSVGGSESGYIMPDPRDPNIFYVSGTYGELSRFDRRTMQSQNIAPWPVTGGIGTEIDKWKYRDPWTPVLAFSPFPGHELFLGTQFVMRTLDGGLHWQTISPDLTRSRKPAASNLAEPVSVADARERGYGVVYTIAPSPLRKPEIWVGSDTGLIHLTRDGGKNWSDVTPPGLSAWSKISLIEASHFNSGEAYAAVDRHRLDDMRPYLYRTRDFGDTWQPVVNGIAGNAFLRAVREDPKKKGLLFAATELGVYVSFDDGDHWESLQLNLPVTSVRDLVIHGNDLVIATHGRAFWVLDDITPLRQIDSGAAESKFRLYKPAHAYRITSDSFPGTPLPPDEPQAENPRRGAYIDYYLGEGAGELTLEIQDTQGHTVRRYSSQEKMPEPPQNVPIAPRWFPKPQVLSAEPGMHRFIWDLRYGRSGAEIAGDNDDPEEEHWVGPLVLPGAYKVKLTAGAKTSVQPLEISMDPRCRATAAELAAQFRWAQRAFEEMIVARKSVAEVKGLQAQLESAKAQIAPDQASTLNQIKAAAEKADQILSGAETTADQGLQSASRGLTVALSSLESADRNPPSQVIALYLQSSRTLKARLADWAAFKRSALANLNQQLRSDGLPAIEISRIEEQAEQSLSK